MESYTIKHLTFSYPGQSKLALNDLTFSVPQGQFLTVCGFSGCGKSTLLRQLKPILSPHGVRCGEIWFENAAIQELSQQEQSAKIGYVMQSPDNQIVTDKVWHELAFGLESLGFDTPTIRLRVAEMASFFGIQTWFHKNVSELSGGQKQLLNLAAIMAMQPSVLILDEPTSQLDPIAAADFLATIGKINRELGVTVILTEHRLEEVFPLTDRVLIMDGGRIIGDGSPQEVGELLKSTGHNMFLAMPTPMRVYAGVDNDLPCPVTVREGRAWLDKFAQKHPLRELPVEKPKETPKELTPAIELDEIWFRYEKEAPDVVKGLSLKIYPGESYAVVGGNGTGKTTTLSLISGINRPYRGKIKLHNQDISKMSGSQLFNNMLGVLPQNPQSLFVKKTVHEDLKEILSEKKLSKEGKESRINHMVKLCDLEGLLSMHPYDLSGGEQQRAALAKVLLLAPQILLLDEPTKGMDAQFKIRFAQLLNRLKQADVTIVMVSHDIEFCAQYADRCAMFFDGGIVTENAPRSFFSGNSFYTTSANRMARQKLQNAVTSEDIIYACGVDAPKLVPEDDDTDIFLFGSPKEKTETPITNDQVEVGSRRLSKRTMMALFMILIAIPLTIYIGIFYMGDRKYYFISMLIILETMLPFAMVFESRKPQARELVTISVLCAIAIAGRAAFFMLPQFKPVVAVVIIAGVAFGGEAGFLVGAVTGFVSNMFFGQGPWTPWQMFAFGIIGFLGGVSFRRGFLRRSKVSLCIFGGFATFFIFGGIMNPSSVLMSQARPTAQMFIAAYLRGIPMDLVHAAATVIFLWLISQPMLEKLDRIKVKYGLIE